MTEAVFFAALMALLYFSVRFRETQGWGAVAGAGLAACAGTLVRYEGWFLIPSPPCTSCARHGGGASAWRWSSALWARWARSTGWRTTGGWPPIRWVLSGTVFGVGHQGNQPYPGRRLAEGLALLRTAAQLCSGPGLALMAMAGAAGSLAKRVFWPLALLALPGVSTSGAYTPPPPHLRAHALANSYYNARYGLAALPLLVVASADWSDGASALAGHHAALVVAAERFTGWCIRRGNWVSGRNAPSIGVAPRLDSRDRRVPGTPLRTRFRHRHIVRRLDRHLPPDGNPAARDVHRG